MLSDMHTLKCGCMEKRVSDEAEMASSETEESS